jgi:hypothetical protein
MLCLPEEDLPHTPITEGALPSGEGTGESPLYGPVQSRGVTGTRLSSLFHLQILYSPRINELPGFTSWVPVSCLEIKEGMNQMLLPQGAGLGVCPELPRT